MFAVLEVMGKHRICNVSVTDLGLHSVLSVVSFIHQQVKEPGFRTGSAAFALLWHQISDGPPWCPTLATSRGVHLNLHPLLCRIRSSGHPTQ